MFYVEPNAAGFRFLMFSCRWVSHFIRYISHSVVCNYLIGLSMGKYFIYCVNTNARGRTHAYTQTHAERERSRDRERERSVD